MACQVLDLDHSTPCLQILEYHSQVNQQDQLAVNLAREECQVQVSLKNQVQDVGLTYLCHLVLEEECQIWDPGCHLVVRICHQEDLVCQVWDLEDLICQVNLECLDLVQIV